MPGVQVDEFLFDDTNEEKFAEHGVPLRSVIQLLDNPYAVTKNRGDRAAPYVLVGRDGQGRCIAVPIMKTHETGLWRPVTAWFCKSGEFSRLPPPR